MKKERCLLGRLDTKAFTLIELLVVVLIIGILAAVAVPQYQKAVLKSRYAQAKVLVRSIVQAEQSYFMANGEYGPLDELDIEIGGTPTIVDGKDVGRAFSWGACRVEGVADEYDKKAYCTILINNQRIRYQEYFNGIRVCTATDTNNTNALHHQLCQSETGKKLPVGTDNEKSYYYY